jgi:hypothetical protein
MQLLAAIAPHVGKILDTVQRLVNRSGLKRARQVGSQSQRLIHRSGLKRARQVGSPLNAVPH